MATLTTLITDYMDPRPAEERAAFARDVQAAGQIKLAVTTGSGILTIQCSCIVDGVPREYFFDVDRKPEWDTWLAELVMRYQSEMSGAARQTESGEGSWTRRGR
jgi:hypothetical protein